ncbi:MAG TPA: UBP-type zinc finger domain-containing protein [Thermoanaerobaculia bacterium]
MSSVQLCEHLSAVTPELYNRTPNTHGCEECLQSGDSWVHLRTCLECGHMGCCDSSKNKHATKHYHRSKHPVVRSAEPGEAWIWCYKDEDGADV